MTAIDLVLRLMLTGTLAVLFAGGTLGAVLVHLVSQLWRVRELAVWLVLTVGAVFGAGYLALYLVLRG